MTALQLLIIVGFFVGFLLLRFGLPLAICWLISQINQRFVHLQQS